ncbi:MAG: hypothetical protein M3N53_12095 [Actinomycetota bacterium]|nr:hypothetical protein [Actinomycetota bacterium]
MNRSRIAWSFWGLALVLLIAGVALYIPNEIAGDGVFSPQMFLVPGFATVGAVVASRSNNRIGWLYLGLGVVASLTLFAAQLDERVQLGGWQMHSVRPLAAWLGNWTWPLNYVLLGLSLLLFPDGHLPSRGWRWVARTFVVCWGLVIFGTMFQSEQLVLGDPEGEAVPNPVAIPGVTEAFDVLGLVLMPLAIATLGAAALAPVVRYRSGDSTERQQIRWLAYTLLAVIVVVSVGGLVSLFSSSVGGAIMSLSVLIVTVGIPVAVGMAILRYRLYDIDVVINRALVYAVLTAALAAVYLGIVVVMQRLLGSFTEESDLAVAASTLAVAALFRPLRSRIQAFIDQRFYRRKYDARRTLDSFSSRLRDTVDLDSLSNELVEVVGETMQPAHVSVWIRPSEVPA